MISGMNKNWSNKDLNAYKNLDPDLDIRFQYAEVKAIIEVIQKNMDKIPASSKPFALSFMKDIKKFKVFSFKQVKVLRDFQKYCDSEYLKSPRKNKAYSKIKI